jgi:hypothetical protein
MDINLFALELQVEAKLAEARAVSARRALLESLGARPAVLEVVGGALMRLGWLVRRRGRRGRAARIPVVSVP